VVATAAVSGIITNCVFTGWLAGNNPPLLPGSPAAFFIRGTNTDFDNGRPVQFLVLGCSAYHTQNAVGLNGIEGGFVQYCNFVAVANGVYWEDGFGRPQLNVSNCHINAKNYGIYANNCTQATIIGNLFYGNDESQSDLVGVILSGTIPAGSSFFNISGNTFHNTNVTRPFAAVKSQKAAMA
jgi:hypothetical protein